MKKIHLTESQVKRLMNEITLSGDESLNATKNIQTATKQTLQTAKNSGVNTDTAGASVAFSADALKKNGLSEKDEENEKKPVMEGKVYTKKQMDDARVKKLMNESYRVTTKKDILNK